MARNNMYMSKTRRSIDATTQMALPVTARDTRSSRPALARSPRATTAPRTAPAHSGRASASDVRLLLLAEHRERERRRRLGRRRRPVRECQHEREIVRSCCKSRAVQQGGLRALYRATYAARARFRTPPRAPATTTAELPRPERPIWARLSSSASPPRRWSPWPCARAAGSAPARSRPSTRGRRPGACALAQPWRPSAGPRSPRTCWSPPRAARAHSRRAWPASPR
eukprot:1903014-Prymnesium_polylepis.1